MYKKSINLYRPCVGICVINQEGNVFIAHRHHLLDPENEAIAYIEHIQKIKNHEINLLKADQTDNFSFFKDFLWQMPQGGINKDEDIKEAAQRELYEETGIQKVDILKISREWYFYDLPKEITLKCWGGKYKGQRQKWILMRFLGEETEINLDVHPQKEFNDWRWVSPNILPIIVVPFKRKVYESVIKEFFKCT